MSGAVALRAGPGTRGRTELADRVVQKIARQAAEEVDGTGGVARRVLGVRAGSRSHARVETTVDGDLVTVRIRLAVAWPADVRAVAARVRSHVGEQVTQATGFDVAEVDVHVPRIDRSPAEPQRRVV